MTVLMTLVGVVVFILSNFTVGFKASVKRLWVLILTGVVIDALIATIFIIVTYSTIQF